MNQFHGVAIKPYDSTQQLGNDLRHLGLGSSDRSTEKRMSINFVVCAGIKQNYY